MHVQSRQSLAVKASRVRRLIGVTFVASLVAALAAIPTGSALALPPTEGTVVVTAPISLPIAVLNPALKDVPVQALDVKNLDAEELSKQLASLPALSGLVTPTQLSTPLTSLLSLHPNLTFGQLTEGGLLGGVLSLLGLAQNPTSNEVLAGLLGSASTLPEAQTAVQQLLTQLGATLRGNDPTDTQGLVEELLGTLTPTQLSSLETELGGGGPFTTGELAAKVMDLLKSGTEGEVGQVVQELLGGVALQPSTLGGLAGQLGTSVETLATDLGTSVEDLSGGLGLTAATALPTLIAPLANGKFLTLIDGPEGLKVTTVETQASKEVAQQEKEAKESKEAKERTEGGTTTGTTSSTGTTGTSGSTTVVVTPSTPVAPAVPIAIKAAAKIKILSHRVKGHVATLVLQVPAAGKVVVSGGGMKAINKKATKSERLTVRITLSKAGTASLHKRHRLKVALKVAFKPTSGSSSSAGVTVHFA